MIEMPMNTFEQISGEFLKILSRLDNISIDKSDIEDFPSKYDVADGFSEGLARVILNGKWGFIDKSGREVIPCKYDNAWKF